MSRPKPKNEPPVLCGEWFDYWPIKYDDKHDVSKLSIQPPKQHPQQTSMQYGKNFAQSYFQNFDFPLAHTMSAQQGYVAAMTGYQISKEVQQEWHDYTKFAQRTAQVCQVAQEHQESSYFFGHQMNHSIPPEYAPEPDTYKPGAYEEAEERHQQWCNDISAQYTTQVNQATLEHEELGSRRRRQRFRSGDPRQRQSSVKTEADSGHESRHCQEQVNSAQTPTEKGQDRHRGEELGFERSKREQQEVPGPSDLYGSKGLYDPWTGYYQPFGPEIPYGGPPSQRPKVPGVQPTDNGWSPYHL